MECSPNQQSTDQHVLYAIIATENVHVDSHMPEIFLRRYTRNW